VTVALNGDGGDESFAGYNRYLSHPWASRLDALPRPLRAGVVALGARVRPDANISSTRNRIRRLSSAMDLAPPARYARSMSYFDVEARAELYTDEYKEIIGESAAPEIIEGPWRDASADTPVDVMLEVDLETYLPGDLLVKMDIATMAYSLEARSPFLDHELMEFAAALPASMKLRGLQKKVILRDALRDAWLPSEILDRPKMGFGVPIVDWFQNELRGYVEDVLFDPETRARGYFNEPYVRRLLDRHVAGAEDNAYKLWALLVLELWHREFVDVPSFSPAAA
jgi:asparagine synthase (glutamine-hydrolysing)